jgi:putative ABC transport system permease protein
MRMEPYSVWLSLDNGTTSLELYEAINEAEIRVSRMRDTGQDLVALKNDPQLQGMNGTLTLGFIITLCITFIGFLIYWVLSIRSRLLQFGILRAMGLSRMGLVVTLIWEQLLVSGSAIATGFGVGILTSRLFVPPLQFIYAASEQVPPFLITASWSDYTALLFAFGGMLIAGLATLIIMIHRLKLVQVLKLGED